VLAGGVFGLSADIVVVAAGLIGILAYSASEAVAAAPAGARYWPRRSSSCSGAGS
jgi:hypothetical protein